MSDFNADMIHKKIGQNVAKYRNEAGISQLDLSLKLGHKSVSIVASAERYYKKKHFNIIHLIQIADILGVEVCELLDIK